MEHIVALYETHWIVPYIVEFVIIFLLFYLIYSVFINKKRKTYVKGKKHADIDFFVRRYQIDVKKLGYKRVLKTVTLMNCFILSFTYIIFSNIDNILWALAFGFAIGFILIYSLYEIVGRHFRKEGKDKNV